MKKLIIIVVMLLCVLFYIEIRPQTLLIDPYEGYIVIHHYQNETYAIEADLDGELHLLPIMITDGKIVTLKPYIIVTRPEHHYLIIFNTEIKHSYMFVFEPYHEMLKGLKLQ